MTLRNLAITPKDRVRASPRIQRPGHQVSLVNGGFRTSDFHVAPVKKNAARRCCSMDAVSVVAGPATIAAAKQLSSLSDGLRERPLSLSRHCLAVLTKVKVQSRPVVHRESRRRQERVDISHSREAGDRLLTV
jgi:hypothetical protein